jgi:hypothetical protein
MKEATKMRGFFTEYSEDIINLLAVFGSWGAYVLGAEYINSITDSLSYITNVKITVVDPTKSTGFLDKTNQVLQIVSFIFSIFISIITVAKFFFKQEK